MEAKELLQTLSNATGVSGHEMQIADATKAAFAPLIHEARVDKLGNCIMLRRGEGKEPRVKVMLAGHMDEVGLIVTKIEDGGFLRFTMIGIDQRTLPGQEVVVHGRQDLPGLIGSKPPHLLAPSEAQRAMKYDELYIDVGLPKDEVEDLVTVGDLITMGRTFIDLKNNYAAGKAFDDRAGVVVMFEALSELAIVAPLLPGDARTADLIREASEQAKASRPNDRRTQPPSTQTQNSRGKTD